MSADFLSVLGSDLELAGLLAIVACVLLFLASLRYRRRVTTTPAPPRAEPSAAAENARTAADWVPDRSRAHRVNPPRQPIATPARPLASELPVDEQHRLDALLEEYGFKQAGQRMQSTLSLWFADSSIDYKICELASDDLIVERGARLGGEWVSHTLWTRTGVYAVLPLNESTDDLATVDATVRRLPMAEAIVRDLRSGISPEVEYAAKVVFLCPYTDEPPRVWYGSSAGEAWLIGGIERLKEWLSSQPGPRVDRQVLELLREKQKPREVNRSPKITGSTDTRHR
jgi:hypothetical protein